MDYYAILGVNKSATDKEIKSAYKKLAKKFHPDVNKDPDAQDKFKEISRAYQVLTDPKKRQAYDQMGHSNFEQARKQGFNGQSGGYSNSYNVNFEDLFGGGFKDPMDIFSEIFGGGFSGGYNSRARRQDRGEDLELVVKISFNEAVFGGEKEIEYSAFTSCKNCKGTGSNKGHDGQKTCAQCGGSGQVRTSSNFLGAQFSQVVVCPECRGSGQMITDPCRVCGGQTRERTNVKKTVKIPAGVDNGTQMRVPGAGNAGKSDSIAGDLYIVFKVEKHPIFERIGSDLHLRVPVTLSQAALGDTIPIPTLENEKKIKIPAGTNHLQQIKLTGEGVQRLNRSGRGDLIITIDLLMPQKLSKEEKELFEDLKKIEKKPKNIFDKIFA